MTNTKRENKMTFEEKCKTPKGAFLLNLFCLACWSFVMIMNLLSFDMASKFDIFLMIIDGFLVIYYFIFSISSFRKMRREKKENSGKNEVIS